jgi:hypothetical protein
MASHPSGERFTVELEKGTNWWGAFVIGLAGTILVIGLAGYALLALGGVAITLFIVLTLVGVFLCFCLAELAAAFPDRAGTSAVSARGRIGSAGSPSRRSTRTSRRCTSPICSGFRSARPTAPSPTSSGRPGRLA